MGSNRKRKRRHQHRNKRPRVGDLPLGFGRFFGRPISKVPRRYLLWAVSDGAQIPETDHWAITEFLRGSKGRNKKPKPNKRNGRPSTGRPSLSS